MKRSTPPKINASSARALPHTVKLLYGPLVAEVEELSQYVNTDDWVEAVCGVSPSTLHAWESYIKEKNWFEKDAVIHQSLLDYCGAIHEKFRYNPLANMINRILVLTAGSSRTPDGLVLPQGPPPIGDIKFYTNDPIYLYCPPEQGDLAAQRKPDVLCGRKFQADRREGEGTTKNQRLGSLWSQVLLYVELKREKSLIPTLEQRKKLDGLPSQYEYTDPKVVVEPPQTATPVVSTADAPEAKAQSKSKGKKRARSEESEEERGRSAERAHPDRDTEPQVWTERKSERAQMAGYALELAGSTRGTRLHHIGIFLRDDYLTLWYLDASGPVRAGTGKDDNKDVLSIIDNFERVAAIFIALSYCDAEQFGALPPQVIRPPPPQAYPDQFPPNSLTNFTINMAEDDEPEHVATLYEHLFTQYVLFGRRTTVYKAFFDTEDEGSVHAIKISQQYTGRKSEVALVAYAWDAGVKYLPKIIKHRDIWMLSQGVRRHRAFRNFDDRVMRCIIFPCYTPLTEHLRKHPNSLKTMVKQMLRCIHDLRYKAHILHRDISDSNIMYTKKNGEDWFILNDFDLATEVDADGRPRGATARHRTGTLPFMAVEILKEMQKVADAGGDYTQQTLPHCVRFDYQSLLFVSIWCAVKIRPEVSSEAEEKTGNAYLRRWEQGDYGNMSTAKKEIMTEPQDFGEIPFSPLFDRQTSWLEGFMWPFSDAHAAGIARLSMAIRMREKTETTQSFKEFETAYGQLTLEKILYWLQKFE